MIEIGKTEVYGWEAAIRGMRNPMNSWDKSDSGYCEGRCSKCDNCPIKPLDDYAPCYQAHIKEGNLYVVGEKDLTLMKQLVKAGTDHSKFMRMITVTCDIVAPLYWWKEFDTYKVGTVRNSCSTMHTIHKKKFELDDFSHEHMYSDDDGTGAPDHAEQVTENVLMDIISNLNYSREYYLETGDKRAWYNMIQLLPCSYNQKATVQMNYAVLRNMYHSRKNHKLNEWHDFCVWISDLPYHELIIMKPEETQHGETITLQFKGRLVSET